MKKIVWKASVHVAPSWIIDRIRHMTTITFPKEATKNGGELIAIPRKEYEEMRGALRAIILGLFL